jgi:hypothetical protein
LGAFYPSVNEVIQQIVLTQQAVDATQSAIMGSLYDAGGGGSYWGPGSDPNGPGSQQSNSAFQNSWEQFVSAWNAFTQSCVSLSTNPTGMSVTQQVAQAASALYQDVVQAMGGSAGALQAYQGANYSGYSPTFSDSVMPAFMSFSQLVSLQTQLVAFQNSYNAAGGVQIPVFTPATGGQLIPVLYVLGGCVALYYVGPILYDAIGLADVPVREARVLGQRAVSRQQRRSNPGRRRVKNSTEQSIATLESNRSDAAIARAQAKAGAVSGPRYRAALLAERPMKYVSREYSRAH